MTLDTPTTTAPNHGSAPDPRRTARPVQPARGTLRGAGLGEVTLAGGFWGDLQDRNAAATLEHCADWMERLGWIENFDRVARGTMGPDRPGWQFSDSEIYKLLEALAWEHGRSGDTAANELFERLVDRVLPAEAPDGYLNTCYGHSGRPGRYTDLSSGHELYCSGHLLQAAVARLRTTGEDRFTALGRRVADHVVREFGSGARDGICGHPEIEVALAEFARATGDDRYRVQAELFVERRGHGTLDPIALLGPAYFQDEVPVRDTEAWHGHAVRALYLAAGAVDVAVENGDADLLSSLEGQWHHSVERRTYVTGGMGSRHQDEGFGDDWELPPDRAYCETCAGIASNMVSWRLYLATGRVEYVDLMERTSYNVLATSPSPDGTAFFYANPLQQRVVGAEAQPDEVNARAEGGTRAPWFEVSCCPTNVARTLASWHTYAAAVDGGTTGVLLQYAAGEVRLGLDDGDLVLIIDTSYPNDGMVRIRVDEAGPGAQLRLRVPGWTAGAGVTTTRSGVNEGTRQVAPGWLDIGRVAAGDEILLRLPTTPRFSWPDPRIDAVRGTVVVERGPLVLCLESTDLPAGASLDEVHVDVNADPREHADGAIVRAHLAPAPELDAGHPPFASRPPLVRAGAALDLPLVPYHRWAQRGAAAMRVFLPLF